MRTVVSLFRFFSCGCCCMPCQLCLQFPPLLTTTGRKEKFPRMLYLLPRFLTGVLQNTQSVCVCAENSPMILRAPKNSGLRGREKAEIPTANPLPSFSVELNFFVFFHDIIASAAIHLASRVDKRPCLSTSQPQSVPPTEGHCSSRKMPQH